ncbi:hypothetical protein [Amycolatopsis sp. NPDC058986]|uniref:hypothetical protein n=1 Tax=unclassified Amycolatopsis TaxID=2618356 RepID=UPI00366AEE5D
MDIVLGLVVLGTAQVALLVLLAGGLLGSLSAGSLLALAAGISAAQCAVGLVWFRAAAIRSCRTVKGTVAGLFKGRANVLIVLAAVLVAGQYVWRTVLGLSFPMVDYDTLAYHLLGPDSWLQQGRIGHTPQNLFADVYPDGQGLIVAWVGAFLGTTKYAWMAHFPFIAMGFLATAGLARQLGAGRGLACFAGLVFLAAPSAFLEVPTGMVDIAAAATAVAAIYLTLSMSRVAVETGAGTAQFARHLAVAGWALGLAVSVKSSNLLTVVLVGVLVFVAHRRIRRESAAVQGEHRAETDVLARLRPLAVSGALLGLPMACLGAYWYIRTWLAYDNPFYPVSMLGFAGRGPADEVLRLSASTNMPEPLRDQPFGWLGQTFRSWWDDLSLRDYDYAPTIGGFGMVWLPIIVPLAALGCYVLFRRGRRVECVALVGFAVLWLAMSPAAWYGRLNLIVVAIGAALAMVGLTAISSRWVRNGLLAAAVAAMAVTMWWATNPSYYQVRNADGSYHLLTAAEVARHIWLGNTDEVPVEPVSEYRGLDAAVPEGGTIAVSSTTGDQPFTHPLLGDRGQRRLVVLDNPRTVEDLRAQMHASGASYVLVGGTYPQPEFAAAINNDRTHFRLVRVEGGLQGASLYQLGDFPGLCPSGVPEVSATMGKAWTVDVGVKTRCGNPVVDDTVTLFYRESGKPDQAVSVTQLNDDGTARFVVPEEMRKAGGVLFTRTQGIFGTYYRAASGYVPIG